MFARLRNNIGQRFENWVVARHRPEAGPVDIRRGRCYILPARPAYGFGFMLLAMLLGSMNYSNNLAFGLTFLLGGMALVGMHHTNNNLLGLKVQLRRIVPVFAGEPAWLPVHLLNPSARERYTIVAGRQRLALSADTATDVPAGGDGLTGFAVDTTKRGVFPVPRFAVATEFPLGLFQAWSWISLDQHYLVYPKPSAQHRPIPPSHDASGHKTGQQAGREDFAGLRDYQPGDALRSVHWKSYSHSGQLSVKTFSDPQDESLWLDWDKLPDLRDPEARLSQLCRWVLDCDARRVPYGLKLPGSSQPPGLGTAHRERCLELLARFDQA